jgi:hypothetical protein
MALRPEFADATRRRCFLASQPEAAGENLQATLREQAACAKVDTTTAWPD